MGRLLEDGSRRKQCHIFLSLYHSFAYGVAHEQPVLATVTATQLVPVFSCPIYAHFVHLQFCTSLFGIFGTIYRFSLFCADPWQVLSLPFPCRHCDALYWQVGRENYDSWASNNKLLLKGQKIMLTILAWRRNIWKMTVLSRVRFKRSLVVSILSTIHPSIMQTFCSHEMCKSAKPHECHYTMQAGCSPWWFGKSEWCSSWLQWTLAPCQHPCRGIGMVTEILYVVWVTCWVLHSSGSDFGL